MECRSLVPGTMAHFRPLVHPMKLPTTLVTLNRESPGGSRSRVMRMLPILLLAAIALSGCAPTWPKPAPANCPKHHQPLESRTMYAPPAGTMIDPSDEYLEVGMRVGDQLPYVIPFRFAEKRSSDFPVRYRVRFCPVCEIGMAQ